MHTKTAAPFKHTDEGSLDSTLDPALNKIFKPPVKIDRPLPEAFEDNCKRCDKHMKQIACTQWGSRQPFATFHCDECRLFLYIYPAEPDLLVWSDTLRGTINIPKRIDELLEERAHKDLRRKRRYGDQ